MALHRRTTVQTMHDMLDHAQSQIAEWREQMSEHLEALQLAYDTIHQSCQDGFRLLEQARVLVAVLDPLEAPPNGLSEFTKGAWASLAEIEEYIKYLAARTENFQAK